MATPNQLDAYNKLPTVELNLAELSISERFTLMQLQGNLPFATPEQIAELRGAGLGLSRIQQLGLLADGLDQLAARGAVVRDGVNADGQPQYVLYPKVKLHTPMQTLKEVQAVEDAVLKA